MTAIPSVGLGAPDPYGLKPAAPEPPAGADAPSHDSTPPARRGRLANSGHSPLI